MRTEERLMRDSLVSIRKSMDEFERRRLLTTAALQTLSSVIVDIDRSVVAPCWPDDRPLPSLVRLADAVAAFEEAGNLSPARGEVKETLKACEGYIRLYRDNAAGIEDCIQVLETAARQLAEKGAKRETSLRAAATSLEQAASSDDMPSLRQRLRAQVSHILSLADEMSRENKATLAMLEHEVATCRERISTVEMEALTDPLTRLGNRRAAEQRIEEDIADGTQFSLILIDLDRFKQVNDMHGHVVGDELLRVFAGRLRHNMRGEDFAARWGGDEFMVLLRCGLGDAMRRLRTLQPVLCGPYALGRGDRALKVHVSASFGIAERKEAESSSDLIQRADKLLYHQKSVTG